MEKGDLKEPCQFGPIKTPKELGAILRIFRKYHRLTLEKVSGLSNLSMRFLSELERGKETAELGKTLEALNKLGLEIIIQPRGKYQRLLQMVKKINSRIQSNDK